MSGIPLRVNGLAISLPKNFKYCMGREEFGYIWVNYAEICGINEGTSPFFNGMEEPSCHILLSNLACYLLFARAVIKLTVLGIPVKICEVLNIKPVKGWSRALICASVELCQVEGQIFKIWTCRCSKNVFAESLVLQTVLNQL